MSLRSKVENGHSRPTVVTSNLKAATPAPDEDPIPLDDPDKVIPTFPLHVLPRNVGRFIEAVAQSVYCPVDYPAVAVLATASAAIGASFVIEVKSDFKQGAGLYCGIVGDPSAKKSPAIKHVIRPLLTESSRRAEEMIALEKAGDGLPRYWPHGKGDVVVQDTTVERLAELLQRQPRGVLLYRPELIGWLASMNQYKAKGVGADRSFFLEVYDSEPITIHRKNQGTGSVYVSRPSLAMVGATQPDVVRQFFESKDGLAERILWTYPPLLPARGERFYETDPTLTEMWNNTVGELLNLRMAGVAVGEIDNEKRPYPRTVRLSEAAKERWQVFTDKLAHEQNDPDFPTQSKSAFGKLEGAAARIALILQFLSAASGESSFDVDFGILPEWVDAASEVAFYFGGHAKRVLGESSSDNRINAAKRILAWAQEQKGPLFTKSDLWRSLRKNSMFSRPEDLSGPLRLMQEHKLIYLTVQEEAATGRPPAPAYRLNTKLVKASTTSLVDLKIV